MHHSTFFPKQNSENSSLTFFNRTRYIKLTSRHSYYTCNNHLKVNHLVYDPNVLNNCPKFSLDSVESDCDLKAR